MELCLESASTGTHATISTVAMAPLQLLLLLTLLALVPSLKHGVRRAAAAPSLSRPLASSDTTHSVPTLPTRQRALFVEERLERLDNAMIKLVMDCAAAQQRYRSKLADVSSELAGAREDASARSWDGMFCVMAGLDAWSAALTKGCLPYSDVIMGYDQPDGIEALHSDSGNTFPEERLCRQLCHTFQELDLPRLTGAHPEVVPAVLRYAGKLLYDANPLTSQSSINQSTNQPINQSINQVIMHPILRALLQITSNYYSGMRRRIEQRQERARLSEPEERDALPVDW